MSYASANVGAIRKVVQSDIDDGKWFRGVLNFGADVSISFESAPDGGVNTETIPSGGMYGFKLKLTSLPPSDIYVFIDFEKEAQ